MIVGSRKQISQRNPLSRLENEALYERLKRAQRCRLEDQRGTEINFELPDFLKVPRCSADGYSESLEIPIDGRASEPILGCRPRLVYQVCIPFIAVSVCSCKVITCHLSFSCSSHWATARYCSDSGLVNFAKNENMKNPRVTGSLGECSLII